MNAQYAPGIVQQMLDARQTCRDLAALLLEENANLQHGNVTAAEARLALKKRLSLRLEKLMQDIKAQREAWKSNSMANNTASLLAQELSMFQKLASNNETMLRAAHQIRADIVAIIRDAAEAQAPKVQTYGKTGTLNQSSAGIRVMAKEV